MKWRDSGRSSNLEDRRGGGGRRAAGGIGIVGLVVVLGVSFFTGANPLDLLGVLQQGQGAAPSNTAAAPIEDAAEEPMVRFMSATLDDAQGMWRAMLATAGWDVR